MAGEPSPIGMGRPGLPSQEHPMRLHGGATWSGTEGLAPGLGHWLAAASLKATSRLAWTRATAISERPSSTCRGLSPSQPARSQATAGPGRERERAQDSTTCSPARGALPRPRCSRPRVAPSRNDPTTPGVPRGATQVRCQPLSREDSSPRYRRGRSSRRGSWRDIAGGIPPQNRRPARRSTRS